MKTVNSRTIYTLEEWQAEAKRLFGNDVNKWRFKCPGCGHVQTRQDYLDMGMGKQCDRYLAFSCIGRFRQTDPMKKDLVVDFGELDKGAGCHYVGGGLFNVSPVGIETGKDEIRYTFGFAP